MPNNVLGLAVVGNSPSFVLSCDREEKIACT
jgi:hypothetical protein